MKHLFNRPRRASALDDIKRYQLLQSDSAAKQECPLVSSFIGVDEEPVGL